MCRKCVGNVSEMCRKCVENVSEMFRKCVIRWRRMMRNFTIRNRDSRGLVFLNFLLRVKEFVNSDSRFGFLVKNCMYGQLDTSRIRNFGQKHMKFPDSRTEKCHFLSYVSIVKKVSRCTLFSYCLASGHEIRLLLTSSSDSAHRNPPRKRFLRSYALIK